MNYGYNRLIVPISEKYLLTVKGAGAYFNIGVKRMRRLAEDNIGVLSIFIGNRYLVIRQNLRNISAKLLRSDFVLSAVSSCYFSPSELS